MLREREKNRNCVTPNIIMRNLIRVREKQMKTMTHIYSDLFKVFLFSLLITAAMAVGCNGKSKNNILLDHAREAYSRAAANPDVSSHASAEMSEAARTLEAAASAKNKAEIERLAYLAERKVQIAEAIAEQKKAEKQMEGLRGGDSGNSRGTVFTLGEMSFASGKAELQPGTADQISKVLDFLKENPNRYVLVEGHTDSTGSDSLNLSISQRRAEAVKAVLISKGVSADRIKAKGCGESRPVADNSSEEGRRKNRRVEITVLNEGQTE
jgi:outer membrane protein OmpA-like peptidoglycan-associated protein